MSTAEQTANDRYGYGDVFINQSENSQPSKTPKTPHSGEKQKRLTWDAWESIQKDPNHSGGPYIKVYKRSDSGAASLARNSKSPYVEIDIALARELVRSHDYEKAEQLFEAGLADDRKREQKAITVAMRGKFGRILHSFSGARVTKTAVLDGGLPVSFVTIPTKRGKERTQKFIVTGNITEKAVAMPIHDNAERWGSPKIAKEVHDFLRNRAANILASQDRRKERHAKKKKKGKRPQKTVAKG